MTITDAPVSATTAIHKVAMPTTAATTTAAFMTMEIARFALMFRTVARVGTTYGLAAGAALPVTVVVTASNQTVNLSGVRFRYAPTTGS